LSFSGATPNVATAFVVGWRGLEEFVGDLAPARSRARARTFAAPITRDVLLIGLAGATLSVASAFVVG
jgi:hypothetical protein